MKKEARKQPKKRREWPAVVYLWAMGLGFITYIIARIALDGFPHPIHWLMALAGGIAGIGVGWLWYRWRGDLI